MNCFEGYTIRENSVDKWWNTLNNLTIVRGGRTCVHSYYGEMGDDEEGWKKAVLIDFFRSAYLGSGDKGAFMREREGFIDARDFWHNFKRSYAGLKRLDPEGYLAAMEIGRKESELIGNEYQNRISCNTEE